MPAPLANARLQEILRAATPDTADPVLSFAEGWSMAEELIARRADDERRTAEMTAVYRERDQARADLADTHAELTASRALITALRENVWLKDVRILQLDGQDRQDLPPLIEAVALAVVTAAKEAGESHAIPAMQAFWQRQLRIMTGLLQRLLDQEDRA